MVGQAGKLPENAPTEDENDEDLLKKVHHALVEIEVVQGHLECPESGRQFPITNGIPNMLLNENEVWEWYLKNKDTKCKILKVFYLKYVIFSKMFVSSLHR